MYFKSAEYKGLNAFYNTNGFIVIKNFLNQNQIKSLKIKINRKKKKLKKKRMILKKLNQNLMN